ncbi:MAG TPA: helix-turn-helix domain-containing protein [Polyangiaceae bacterium]|nr:helix-turn-helix domain-containing protein [Polyangiaceae bacterium]
MADDDEHFLTAKDIQRRLNVCRARAYEVVAQIPRVKFGKSVRVAESAFAAWLKAHEVPPPPPTPEEARRARIEARQRALATELDEKPIRRMKPRTRKPEAEEPFRIRPTRPRD